MKKIINELPIKTTNSFKVNDLTIELEDNIKSIYHGYDTNINLIDETNIINSQMGLTFDQGTIITMNIDQTIKEPVLLNYHFNSGDNLIEEIIINVSDGCSASLIFNYDSDENDYFHFLKHHIILKDNANLKVSVVNMINNHSKSIITVENDVLNNANLTYNLIDLGGNTKISSSYGNTYNNANNYLNVVYLGTNNDLIDTNYYYINQDKNSNNIIKVEGILKDNATKTFKGTIKFISGSTNSNGAELENVLLLSDNCKSISAPILLCDEENVTGSHAASSGKLSEDKIFYLMSRGITRKDAVNMLVMANIKPIIDNIDNEEIINSITTYLLSVL